MPRRMARHAARIEILRSVARGAMHTDRAKASHSPHHERLVGVAVVALPGTITRGVAVHATRIQDHLARLIEESDGALLIVANG